MTDFNELSTASKRHHVVTCVDQVPIASWKPHILFLLDEIDQLRTRLAEVEKGKSMWNEVAEKYRCDLEKAERERDEACQSLAGEIIARCEAEAAQDAIWERCAKVCEDTLEIVFNDYAAARNRTRNELAAAIRAEREKWRK